MAPQQVKIIPVAEPFSAYAEAVSLKLKAEGLRSSIDISDDSFSKKIRNAELMKIPYIVIVGEKEQGTNTLSIREYRSKKQYEISVEEFVTKCVEEYKKRTSN
ncbi:MAG: His/Gly/Thr/Pro-type tRNA ligase C-terminal domain-containing protein [bacterium]